MLVCRPGSIDQIRMYRLRVGPGQDIVPASHAFGAIRAVQDNLVEQLMGGRRESSQVRQQADPKYMATGTEPVI